MFFVFIGTATTEIYTYLRTRSLHDAPPIWCKPLISTVQTIWVALEPVPQLLGDAPVKLLITCTSEKEPFSYFPSERLPLAEISIPSHGTATISSSTQIGRAHV